MSAELFLQANTPENPYSVDVIVETSGPNRRVFCQLCEKRFDGPLHQARARLLDHYQEFHGIWSPVLHSFFQDESQGMAFHAAWQLRKVGI